MSRGQQSVLPLQIPVYDCYIEKECWRVQGNLALSGHKPWSLSVWHNCKIHISPFCCQRMGRHLISVYCDLINWFNDFDNCVLFSFIRPFNESLFLSFLHLYYSLSCLYVSFSLPFSLFLCFAHYMSDVKYPRVQLNLPSAAHRYVTERQGTFDWPLFSPICDAFQYVTLHAKFNYVAKTLVGIPNTALPLCSNLHQEIMFHVQLQ
jgi:hypothetical protein